MNVCMHGRRQLLWQLHAPTADCQLHVWPGGLRVGCSFIPALLIGFFFLLFPHLSLSLRFCDWPGFAATENNRSNEKKNPGARLLVATAQKKARSLSGEASQAIDQNAKPGVRERKTAMVLAVAATPLVCGLSHMLRTSQCIAHNISHLLLACFVLSFPASQPESKQNLYEEREWRVLQDYHNTSPVRLIRSQFW